MDTKLMVHLYNGLSSPAADISYYMSMATDSRPVQRASVKALGKAHLYPLQYGVRGQAAPMAGVGPRSKLFF